MLTYTDSSIEFTGSLLDQVRGFDALDALAEAQQLCELADRYAAAQLPIPGTEVERHEPDGDTGCSCMDASGWPTGDCPGWVG